MSRSLHSAAPFVSAYLAGLVQRSAAHAIADPADPWAREQLASGGLDQENFGRETLLQGPRPTPRDDGGPDGGDDDGDVDVDEPTEEPEEEFAVAAPGERG